MASPTLLPMRPLPWTIEVTLTARITGQWTAPFMKGLGEPRARTSFILTSFPASFSSRPEGEATGSLRKASEHVRLKTSVPTRHGVINGPEV